MRLALYIPDGPVLIPWVEVPPDARAATFRVVSRMPGPARLIVQREGDDRIHGRDVPGGRRMTKVNLGTLPVLLEPGIHDEALAVGQASQFLSVTVAQNVDGGWVFETPNAFMDQEGNQGQRALILIAVPVLGYLLWRMTP